MNDFADTWNEMYNKSSREKKAGRMVKILNDYWGSTASKKASVLDVGCSTGIIDNFLSKTFKQVTGIDSDQKAVTFAQKTFKRSNLKFQIGDALHLKFPDNYFDLVICTHIYEHVPSSPKMFKEIYRVLKPGGVCLLAAINKYWILEPHYKLPFLSFLPSKLANTYMKVFGKGKKYDILPKSYWQLKREAGLFKLTDYTPKVFTQPSRLGYDDIVFLKKPINFLLYPLIFFLPILSPTFFWILSKEGSTQH